MATKNPKIKILLNPNEDEVTIRQDFELTRISSRQSVVILLGKYQLEISGDGSYSLWDTDGSWTLATEGADISSSLMATKKP